LQLQATYSENLLPADITMILLNNPALLLFTASPFFVDAFQAVPVLQRTCDVVNRRHQLLTRLAKPPPTANFDLEQIEAFEAKMDLESLDAEGAGDNDGNDNETTDELPPSGTEDIRVFSVPVELKGKRIDAVVAALESSLSRSTCGSLVVDGNVQLVEGDDNYTVLNRKSHKVKAGDVLRVTIPNEEKPTEIIAQNIPLDILYEDEHMIVLNKAAGMVVHPAAGNWDGTVVNALAYYLVDSPYGKGDFVGADTDLKTVGQDDDPAGADGEVISFRPGIVHRLDKGTTGILVVAKTTQSLGALSEAFAARTVKKTYLAITVGNPGKRVAIDKPIGRHPVKRQKMRVVPDPHKKDSSGIAPKDRLTAPVQKGRRALSYVDTLAFDGKLSMAQVRIETGRTHQIRVHLQDRHTPIYGDDVYGIEVWNKRLSKTHGIERPLLHAYRLELYHPMTGEKMTFSAPMANDMKEIASKVWPTGKDEIPEIFA
jgi:23S rRNA pseudouridine1911/1915/1917 synthase